MNKKITILKTLVNMRYFQKGDWTMDITLEMIEKVLDATKEGYHTVKNALLEAEGDVEAAIRSLNESPAEEEAETVAENEATEAESTDTRSAETEIIEEPETEPEDAKEADIGPEDKKLDDYAEEIIERLKKRIQEGNVDRIRISREGNILLDIPLNLGLLGGILTIATIPWALILGVITAFGLNCKIEIVTKDGDSEEM